MGLDLLLAIMYAVLLALAFGAGTLFWVMPHGFGVISEHRPRREPPNSKSGLQNEGGDATRKLYIGNNAALI